MPSELWVTITSFEVKNYFIYIYKVVIYVYYIYIYINPLDLFFCDNFVLTPGISNHCLTQSELSRADLRALQTHLIKVLFFCSLINSKTPHRFGEERNSW